ncbi:hypothetical protein VTI74DRAFT_623 [Chaetomium olivicolor]
MKGGFDALKLVSLAVSHGHPQKGDLALDLRDQALWFPDIPQPDLKFVGEDLEDGGGVGAEQLPLTITIFGGPQGQDLGSVVGITVLFDVLHRVVAFEVSFTSGRPAVRVGLDNTALGHSQVSEDDEQPEACYFAIDGPGGERITALDVIHSHVGFRLTTNHGRSADFPSTAPKRPWNIKAMPPDSGQVVGFWTVLRQGNIARIGAICIEAT